jgi:hypothetical protein
MRPVIVGTLWTVCSSTVCGLAWAFGMSPVTGGALVACSVGLGVHYGWKLGRVEADARVALAPGEKE